MNRDARVAVLLAALGLTACKSAEPDTHTPPGPPTDDTGGGGGDDTGATDDTAGGDDTADTSLPDDPTPFTLTVTGAESLTLTFDDSSCTHPMGSSNFSQFWRNAQGEHVFVLALQILGTFEGPGEYTAAADGARVKLQEEAGGELRYYYSDTSSGGTVDATVGWIDEEIAWGEFSFNELHDSAGGTVQVSPMPVPIWCPEVD